MVSNGNKSKLNADSLEKELAWLKRVIQYRLDEHFGEKKELELPHPPIHDENSVYVKFVEMYDFGTEERLCVILALAVFIAPDSLDAFFMKDKSKGGRFTCFGGVPSSENSSFIPTAETFLFIAAGNNLKHRFDLLNFFSGDHVFSKHGILGINQDGNEYPYLAGALALSREYLDLFTNGDARKPAFGKDFPAKEITTEYEWDDLVLNYRTHHEIEEVSVWIEHGPTVMKEWGLSKKLKPGYLSLFYGPPGTGKTLTAGLLAKRIGKPIYRIDLSMIVSKYIGETEKNLSSVFDQAENKDWVLFFDEADALFGKRTKVNDAHDRYANQEVSYLLQRIEDFSGLIILASNLKSNMDEAFTRRFQSIINFPMPSSQERLQLWMNSFSKVSEFEEDVDLKNIADKHELSGGAIMNVVRYASLLSASRHSKVIRRIDIENGIKREFRKEGKIV